MAAVPCLRQRLPAQSALAVQGSPSAPPPLEPVTHAPELHTCPVAQAAHAAPPLPHCEAPCAESATQVLPLQQPDGQVVALQGLTHAPEVQDCPAAQPLQVAPPLPHWATVWLDGATQALPLQQPDGQLVPLHGVVHTPAAHTLPLAQAEQVLPDLPHWVSDWADCATQVLPLQQPDGHVVALQGVVQAPALQDCPVPHAAQAAPPLPQVEAVCADWATQVLPLQQPDGQVVALHVVPPPPPVPPPVPDGAQPPAVHAWPVGQPLQAAPPLPHWALFCAEYTRQVLPKQQPPAQVAGEQGLPPPPPAPPPVPDSTHCPAEQVRPGMQAMQASPDCPQRVAPCAAGAMQVLPSQQPLQLAGPQEGAGVAQVPASHDWPVAQARQAEPDPPQALALWAASFTHVPPWQQPAGQVSGVQSPSPVFKQALSMQACPGRQARQALPEVPHWPLVISGRGMQVSSSQQPAQLEAEHPGAVAPHPASGSSTAEAVTRTRAQRRRAVGVTFTGPDAISAAARPRVISLSDIEAAQKRIAGSVTRTQFSRTEHFPEAGCSQLYFKFENEQRTGSFKERGALNKLLQLTDAERAAGVVSASAGNHAQGVAYHAGRLGISTTIVMPERTPLIKASRTRGYGAHVILKGNGFDEAFDEAVRVQQAEGRTFVHPFDDDQVMAGQGTVGLELLEQFPHLEVVVVPIGGGGLISGIALALKETNPRIQVIGVQPAVMPAMKASLEAGHVVHLQPAQTIADGLAVKRPGKLTFEVIRKYVDDIVTVEEEELAAAILLLLEREKSVVEGAGAAGVAALLSGRIPQAKGKKTGVILCGGNIDVNLVSRIIERGLVKDGRLVRLKVTMPDRPGMLARFVTAIAEHGANVVEIYHHRAFSPVSLGEVQVEAMLETRGVDHVGELKAALSRQGWQVTQ